MSRKIMAPHAVDFPECYIPVALNLRQLEFGGLFQPTYEMEMGR